MRGAWAATIAAGAVMGVQGVQVWHLGSFERAGCEGFVKSESVEIYGMCYRAGPSRFVQYEAGLELGSIQNSTLSVYDGAGRCVGTASQVVSSSGKQVTDGCVEVVGD